MLCDGVRLLRNSHDLNKSPLVYLDDYGSLLGMQGSISIASLS
jgi:hypothetical protein